MTEPSILYEATETRATITLNRPSVYNAIRRDELLELSRIVETLAGEQPKVVILTAAQPGFCSGIDLKESREATEPFARDRCTLMHDVLHRLRKLAAPVITAIDGVAAGLGCELAISGDLRIGSPATRLSYPEPKVAVPSPTFHLKQLIGLARTQDMLFTARWVEAQEALRWGLLTRIEDDPLAAAIELSDQLLALSPISLTRTKENIYVGIADGERGATDHHIEHVARAASTRDRAEALRAFAERRQPSFEGR